MCWIDGAAKNGLIYVRESLLSLRILTRETALCPQTFIVNGSVIIRELKYAQDEHSVFTYALRRGAMNDLKALSVQFSDSNSSPWNMLNI